MCALTLKRRYRIENQTDVCLLSEEQPLLIVEHSCIDFIDSVLEKKDSNGQDLILVPNENETEIRGLMTVMQKAVHDNRF